MTRDPLATWAGPHGGVPPFDIVRVEAFPRALGAAMAEQLDAVAAIVANRAAPTFDNTLAALARSRRAFDRVYALYEAWVWTLSSPELQEVELELAPRLAAFRDRIQQNRRLLERIRAVDQAPDRERLTPEQRRLVWLASARGVRAGAKLQSAKKKRVAQINQRLARLFARFSQNVLAEESGYALFIDQEEDLAGLPPTVRAGAAAAAEANGRPGQWAILNTRSSVEPFLSFSDRRHLRERVFRNFVDRGDHADARDNKKIVSQILQLRGERARILGFPTHAHWRLEEAMAKTPERALALMEAVWPAAVARAREEVADLQALAQREGAHFTIEPWDYRYYAEKVRQERYHLDPAEVRPYLQLEKLREGMFWVAGQLLDFHFRPATDIPVHHRDVRVWEVQDGAGKHVGLWYFDPWARAGKRSGAWMNTYRSQERMDAEVAPITANSANFVKGKPGEPVLVSWRDATTLFHEFGHALHGLSSRVTYPELSGVAVPLDYVEFPSQLLERWLATPEVLGRFALHALTGEPMPEQLIERLHRAAKFNQGFETVEYLSAAWVDMKAHLQTGPVDPAAFERQTLEEIGMPREMVMRHRMPHFAHIFADDEYSAGYYSYLWADTLSADAFEAFSEAKGPYDPEVAARLREHVLSAGNTVDPQTAYRAFRGRDARIDALMRKRGFPAAAPAMS